jgi:hypothetical protein
MNDNLDTPKVLLLIENAVKNGNIYFADATLRILGFII